MRGIFARRIEGRTGSEAADSLLRYAFHLARPDAPLPFARAAQKGGKPYLPAYPDFHFSLSHSGEWAVCAVSEYPLGVDIERIRPLRRNLAERYFSPDECALLAERPPESFFTFWTLKEAAVKATGVGLARGLSRATVTLAPEPVIEDGEWRAFSIPFSDQNYRLSLCLYRADSAWTNDDFRVIIRP